MVPGRGTVLAWSVPGQAVESTRRRGCRASRGCGYVVANVAEPSLPIVAGAHRGGRRLWTWLAWWSGGVLASLASHILWTGLMLVAPGPGRPAEPAIGKEDDGDDDVSFLSTAVQQVLGRRPFLRRGRLDPARSALHAARLRLLGRPGVAHDVARLGEDPRMEGRPGRRGPGPSRRPHRDVHGHGEDLRRPRSADSWGAAVAGATSIARATAAFSKKNARFFAGYAFDARQVPLAWTPPGRVFVGIDLERTALLDEDGVQEGRGRWGGEADVARRRSAR